MEIKIELIDSSTSYDKPNGWKVSVGEKYSDALSYDEMLGLTAALTMPDQRPCLNWMRTEAEHKAWYERMTKKSDA